MISGVSGMRNKFLTMLIASVMLLETVGMNIYAEDTPEAKSAETEIKTERAESIKTSADYPLLKALNIVTDEFSEYDSAVEIVTRGEAAVYLARLYNIEIDLNTSAEYVDVEAHRAISPYIDFAQKMGLFDNMDRRRFRPDEAITRDELSIMACRILGFGGMYGTEENYPEQYYIQAERSKIFRGTSAGNTFARKDFLRILTNILNADICRQVSFGNDRDFSTKTGQSLLKERFQIIKAGGVVTGYGFVNLNGNEKIRDGKISVSQELYDIDITQETDYTAFVGHRVDFYLDFADESKKRIIYMEQSDKSTELNLLGEDVGSETNTNTISYYTGEGRKQTRKISASAVAFFNGRNAGRFSADLAEALFDAESSIKMIDNNGDGTCDVIFIYQYETYVVDSIDAAAQRIYLKYDKLIEGNRYISLTEENGYTSELLINGVSADIDRLRSYNILSCIPTYDGGELENLKIIVSRRSVTGTVNKTSEDRYGINGGEYRLSKHYQSIVGKYPDAPSLKLGSEGRFYLDAIGNIAAVSLTKEIYYGYMRKLYDKNSSPFNEEYNVEIYDETGVWFEGEIAKYVTLDGERVKRTVCAERLRQTGKFEPQVVRFALANNQVSMIDTVQTGSGDSDYDILELKDTYHASMGTDYGNITGRYYRFINQTKFMILPENKDKKDQYSMIGRHSFAEGETVYLKVYGIDEFNTVTFCVYDYSDMQGVETYENYVMVVENVGQVVNEEGETTRRLYGYYARGGWGSGEMTDATLDEAEDGIFQDVQIGDVLMFKLNSERKATRVKAAFTLEEFKTSEPFHKNNTLKDETSFGTILKVDPSRSLLLMDIGGTTTVFWYGAVAAWDVKNDKLIKINPAELTPGKKVFNWGYWNLPFLTLMYME